MNDTDSAGPIVQAPSGRYAGSSDDPSGATFAGIPFAEAPVGTLRFQPPQPLRHTPETFDATRFRAAPAQAGTSLKIEGDTRAESSGGGFSALGGGATLIETSEDCLYLNVWTPDIEGSRPVIVWLYGGGFDTGSAAPPVTNGAALRARTDAVVVSINYRVGALGFGHWSGIGGDRWAESSNLGIQDQITGLQWVQRNISAFGGDPDRVTVAGESAGAFCIGTLLAIPSARQTFTQAIMHSGSTRRIFPTDIADAIAEDLLRAVGEASVDKLQTIGVDRILAAQGQVVDSDIGLRNLAGGRSWGVVLDGTILQRDPLESVRAGDAAGIRLLMGANRDETLIFQSILGAAWPPANDRALETEMSRAPVADPAALLHAYRTAAQEAGRPSDLGDLRTAFLTDAIYRRPAIETAEAQQRAGGSAWTLLFAATPMGPRIGASHGMDLIYLFDHLAAVGIDDAANRRTQDQLFEAWRRFIHHGNPGWPRYRYAEQDVTRLIGGPIDLVTEPPPGPVRDTWPI
ncbi:MAG: carboxylesterase family protein [Actinomycetota bacterium]|nr:carboxylesterase family protein [Actinomycetota bacterium]